MAPTVCPSLESHPGLLLELNKVRDLSKYNYCRNHLKAGATQLQQETSADVCTT